MFEKLMKEVNAEAALHSSKNAEVTTSSQTIAKPNVIRSTKRHAELIIKKLTMRPHLEDSDGYYDMIADENQMIDIVEKYLSKCYV